MGSRDSANAGRRGGDRAESGDEIGPAWSPYIRLPRHRIRSAARKTSRTAVSRVASQQQKNQQDSESSRESAAEKTAGQ